MFEIPDAKRVRRQDLYDSSSERHSSPEPENEETAELRAKLNARLSNLLSLDLGTAEPEPTNKPHPAADGDGDGDGEAQGQEEAEFEFRLFSTSTAAAPKVVLAPDDAEARYDGPALSQRPLSHYIRGELSAEERDAFRRAAVTGQDVLAWAGQRAWGLEVPWRVTKITVVAHGKQSVEGKQLRRQGDATDKPKKRPGKKRRIVLRKRDKAKKEAEAAAEKQKMSKEEHLKEKKKRLNREKKLKRRQKEKEKKAAKGTAGGEEGAGGSALEGSDGEE